MLMASDVLDERVDSLRLAGVRVKVNFFTYFVAVNGRLIHQKIW